MSKQECWVAAYAAALQGCCAKYGAIEDEKNRERLIKFCEKAASDATNAFSKWFHQ